jgi:hypothetical protein
MSLLQRVRTVHQTPVVPAVRPSAVPSQASVTTSPAPYRAGDRVFLATPDGQQLLVRVESIAPRPGDTFGVVAAVVEPRNLRDRLMATVVDAAGTPAFA